ncbi:MAG: carbon starvation protein A [Clostridiales Family XIII bacterium]|nr:carbon starvation protein A [Clostridiales Family XIII bacterium]
MNAILLIIVAIVVLVIAYLTYGRWLAKQWGVSNDNETPAHTMTDGLDYSPAKAPVLLGHHFSSIAGAGPINGPIQAAVFGWLPVALWVLIGGIFFGAVHDFGALFASVRNKGRSIGEVISTTLGGTFKRLFIVFGFLALLLVIAAFASIVAGTFGTTNAAGIEVAEGAREANATTAIISMLFIVMAIVFGFLVYRRNAPLGIASVIGVVAIVAVIALGVNWHPIYLPYSAWMWIVGLYIAVASVAPVWILLQPRDYLSSFLLYGMMALALVGIFVGGGTSLDIPAFTGFKDPGLGFLFPALFVTVACGAVSGFHSLVASGTTAKQLDRESDARPIAYGGMLIESLLAIISVIAVGYIWVQYKELAAAGTAMTPPQAFASGISQMLGNGIGAFSTAGAQTVLTSLLVLTVSVFCLTSLDTATRLARYMFQEFWLKEGEEVENVTGARKVLINPYFATIITVVLGIGLGMTGYTNIWPLFGAANQLLAAIALLGIAAWFGKMGKNNKMFFIPMAFMLSVTVVSLFFSIQSNFILGFGGGEGALWGFIRAIIALVLVVLALVLAYGGIRYLIKNRKVDGAISEAK